MSWEIAEAATRETLEAYIEALQREDWESAEFWRTVVLERLVSLNVAIGDYFGSGGVDGFEQEGGGTAV